MAGRRNNGKSNDVRYYKNKCEQMKYSPSKLKRALEYIESGEDTYISRLSKQFNIPRTTLLYKANGTRPRNKNKPRPVPMLGVEIELELQNWLLNIAKRGFPLTKDGLIYSANTLLQQGYGNPVNTYNKQKGVGHRWYQNFISRHTLLTVRAAEYLHKGRVITSEASIRKWIFL